MPARIERFSEERGCSESNWIDNIAVPFGFAPQVSARFHELRTCDPLRTINWMSEARSMLWSGNPEGALTIARQGLEVAPGEWLQLQLVNDLIALNQFDEADREISLGIKSPEDALATRMMMAAAQGDKNMSEALFDEYVQDPNASRFWELAYYAWTGDQENANRLAREMDAHSFAGPGVATTILWCNCGAPWDLEATPNLAALVADAGFDWPPPSPIRFPLKAW